MPLITYFNSRPCERGFQNLPVVPLPDIFISIHAPARGASTSNFRMSCHHQFQFTPLREGLQYESGEYSLDNIFQFTPLREGLHFYQCIQIVHVYFNSRPCERGFLCIGQLVYIQRDFNSRPCERGLETDLYHRRSVRFQFTPLREGLSSYGHGFY